MLTDSLLARLKDIFNNFMEKMDILLLPVVASQWNT
ncbi:MULTISPECIES: hypothetical protein [unclassified Microcoleus]